MPQIVNSNGKIRGLLRPDRKLAKVDEHPMEESRETGPVAAHPDLRRPRLGRRERAEAVCATGAALPPRSFLSDVFTHPIRRTG